VDAGTGLAECEECGEGGFGEREGVRVRE